MLSVSSVEDESAFDSLLDADAGTPAGRGTERAVIGEIVADVDKLSFEWEVLTLDGTFVGRRHQRREIRQVDHVGATDIDRLANGRRRRRRSDECLRRIVDIEEVAALLPTPDLDWASLEQVAHPNPHENLPRILDSHVRAVGVGQAQ